MPALRVHVVSGPEAVVIARRLRDRDSAGWLAVTVGDQPATVALVVGTRSGCTGEQTADVVLDAGCELRAQVDRLWSERILPFALGMAGKARCSSGTGCGPTGRAAGPMNR